MSELRAELRQLRATYKSKRDDYNMLKSQIQENVRDKILMRAQIKELYAKIKEAKNANQQ